MKSAIKGTLTYFMLALKINSLASWAIQLHIRIGIDQPKAVFIFREKEFFQNSNEYVFSNLTLVRQISHTPSALEHTANINQIGRFSVNETIYKRRRPCKVYHVIGHRWYYLHHLGGILSFCAIIPAPNPLICKISAARYQCGLLRL